jgi:aspartate/methionine/tyrosine aminotransferase
MGMNIEPFALERYFARHEFTARYLLSSSDCEALSMSELLGMADEESLRLWDTLKLGYTESQGHPLLREAVAEIYEEAESIDILTLIPEDGIFLLMHAFLQPGDHVVCTFPAYQSLYEIARAIGCEVTEWKPDEKGGWHFDIGTLDGMMKQDTKLVVVNFPHNPTGAVPTREEFEELVDLTRMHGVRILSDEMYRFLEVENGSTLPSACELYEHAFSLFGLSKTFGLPGLRTGWIASHDHEMLQRITELKDYTTICASAPSEILAIIALRNKKRIIGMQNARIRRNVSLLDSFFSTYSDMFAWNRPSGGSVCFPRMLKVRDTTQFCKELAKETGIMLVPSSLFQFGTHHVRIGYGRENFKEAIEKFSLYLERRFS